MAESGLADQLLARLPPVLRPRDLAALFGCAKQTVYGMVRRQQLPPAKRIGRRLLVWTNEDIAAFLRDRGGKQPA
jgi:predicted DNA-binding transcriptional regulator AlpA